MAHNAPASWAELVPNTGPMTVDDLLTQPGDLAATHGTLKSNDALDGLDVLPGFSSPLADLFA